MKRVTIDLNEVSLHLEKNGIKVYDCERTSAGIRTEYQCRGILGEFGILNDSLRKEAETLMRRYLGEDTSSSFHTTELPMLDLQEKLPSKPFH
ncbi:hypothetical protein [Paenibacillus silviterrae]|uniref:hypothetical protein n=1 Tax=Paenibacillus silviterrae TaxID=3242194 RepID=UPI002543A176|nr:hypothetical protein [Paenibacillus chinjuensis]